MPALEGDEAEIGELADSLQSANVEAFDEIAMAGRHLQARIRMQQPSMYTIKHRRSVVALMLGSPPAGVPRATGIPDAPGGRHAAHGQPAELVAVLHSLQSEDDGDGAVPRAPKHWRR